MKLKYKILLILALIAMFYVISAQTGFCAADTANQVQTAAKASAMNESIAKFLVAMGGVLLSSFIIYAGLTIYNKFFVDKSLFRNNNPEDVLNTPKSVDEAVTLFIKRNKIC